MADADLKVLATADVSQLKTKLLEAQKSIANLSLAAGKLDSTLLKGAKGTNQAAFALQNLGRVAQDAPFGFIGIANNINPLIESFQRLRKESGSTGTAMKALGGALIGAGGLGLAVSLVTSALTFLSMANRESTSTTEKKTKAVDEAVRKQQEFASAVDKASQSVFKEAGNLKDLKEVLISTSTAIGDLTQATIQQGVAQFFFDKKNVAVQKLLSDQIKKQLDLRNKLKPFAAANIPEYNADLFSKNKFDKVIAEDKAALKNINILASDLSEIFANIFGKDKGKSKTAKDLETIGDVLKNMRAELVVLGKQELFFGTNESLAKIKLLEGTVTDLFRKFKLQAEDPIVLKIGFLADDIKERELLRKEIFKILPPKVVLPVSLELAPSSSVFPKEFFASASAQLEKFNSDISKVLNDFNATVLNGVGEALGNALAGNKDVIQNLFTGIFSALGDSLKELGKTAIKVGLGMKAIKASFEKLNPALAIAAGIGLIALGSYIKSSIAKSAPGFAGGGFVDGPGSSTSDSVFARLSRGEYIIRADAVNRFGTAFFDRLNAGFMPPKMNTGGIIGGGSLVSGQQVFIPDIKIKGSDLVLAFHRQEARNSRNG